MLAERLPGLLPPLSEAEALEVTAVHSVAGVLAPGAPLISSPPFRSPHSTASMAAIVGGGSRLLRPGAVSLAHRGVLFLDEAPEFAPNVLDALRQPLESGVVEVARASATARFPARFTLVLAANPCPCGRAGTKQDASCPCPPKTRIAYRQRLSGPLLDRVDLRVQLEPPSRLEFLDDGPSRAETDGAGRGAGGGGPGRGGGAAGGHAVAEQRRGAGGRDAEPVAAAEAGDGGGVATASRTGGCPPAGWTGCCGWRGRSPTCAAGTVPGAPEVETALRLRLPGLA